MEETNKSCKLDTGMVSNEDKKLNDEIMHLGICNYIHNELWIPKNREYGNSFSELYQKLGLISAVTQITHKYNRLVKLATSDEEIIHESIVDTLLDLANYSIMTLMEIEREKTNKGIR